MKLHLPIILFAFFVLHGLVGNLSAASRGSSGESFNKENPRKLISDVSLSAGKFNPSVGERVEIKFSLSDEAHATLKIFDADYELVKTLLEKENKKAGAHKIAWDGKDMDGSPVPDEAYFFTIEAKDKEGHVEVYDPITFSGGEVYDVAQADFDKKKNEIRYRLEHPGRVLVRMGVHRGPLMRTLVDWKPRPAGLNTESWDGRDESGVVNVRDDPYFVAMITYFTLPENVIITFGDDKVSYDEYKAGLKAKRPKKTDRGRNIMSNRPISPHASQPRTAYRTPKIQVTLPEVKKFNNGGLPLIEGMTTVRVDSDEKDRAVVKDRKTEIYFFVNNRFLIEDEKARMPYDFHWNFSNVEDGEHVLTVNLITDNDQIGTVSKKIAVKRSQGAK